MSSTSIYTSQTSHPPSDLEATAPSFLHFNTGTNPVQSNRSLGRCMHLDGPFAYPDFVLNVGGESSHYLTRDFIPEIMNSFARQSLVDKVLESKDYTSFARAIEHVPSFNKPNIHGSGHFGVGGVLGTLGDQYNRPGDALFYLHRGNLDQVFTLWQSKDLTRRLNGVGGPVVPFDCGGKNVTLDFRIGTGIGELAGEVTLKEVLDTKGGVLCYEYESLEG